MRLEVYQALWGMEQLPWRRDVKWTIEEQLDLIKDAGFDGVSLSFVDATKAKQIGAEAIARGLRVIAEHAASTVGELAPVFDTIDALGREHVAHVNLQPNVRPYTLGEGIPYILGCQSLADESGISVCFETHRYCMTTDLLFTLQLIDAVPSMQLTADLSHFVVARELEAPISDEDHAMISRILRRSRAFHGRVASPEQVQVQISFAHHKPLLELFSRWWLEGFRHFQASFAEDEVLTFTTELGPPHWYAITGADGEELSDRWQEALQMATLVRELWQTAATSAATPI